VSGKIGLDVELLTGHVRRLETGVEKETPHHICPGTASITGRLTVTFLIPFARPIEEGLKILERTNTPLYRQPAVSWLEIQVVKQRQQI
jgi:hypothetical protein